MIENKSLSVEMKIIEAKQQIDHVSLLFGTPLVK